MRLLLYISEYEGKHDSGFVIVKHNRRISYLDKRGKWKASSAGGLEPFQTKAVAEMALNEIRKREDDAKME